MHKLSRPQLCIVFPLIALTGARFDSKILMLRGSICDGSGVERKRVDWRERWHLSDPEKAIILAGDGF
jgi:hypothetical protein